MSENLNTRGGYQIYKHIQNKHEKLSNGIL